jgi:hypothetical protein
VFVNVSEYGVVVVPGETVDGSNWAAMRLLLSEKLCRDRLSTAAVVAAPPTTGACP